MLSKLSEVKKTHTVLLNNELEYLYRNINSLQELKRTTINFIEQKKLEFRTKNDATRHYYYYKTCGITSENYFPTWQREEIISNLDKDISAIQNQFDNLYNDLTTTEDCIKEQLRVINKAELLMDLLNYKMYELQYDFTTKLDELHQKKKKLRSSAKSETQMALCLVDLNKVLTELKHTHDLSMHSIKEQKLEAQEIYEGIISVLDNTLEMMKKHLNDLLLVIEAEKAQLETEEVPHYILVGEMEEKFAKFSEMQAEGWKTKPVKDITEFAKTLKLTQEGLLVTKSRRNITAVEAKNLQLLDFLHLYEIDDAEDKTSDQDMSVDSKGEPTEASSTDSTSRMSSEDVSYLKEFLGVPLTLALAEITTVQPRDPIHYLGHWLFKYRYNQEISEMQKIELQQLEEERRRIASATWHKFVEEEARAAVLDMILRAEEEAIKNEFMRIERELQAAEEEGEENLDDEARDKFDTY